MPTEYMSGSPKVSNALPASANTATAKFERQVAYQLHASPRTMLAADLFEHRIVVFVCKRSAVLVGGLFARATGR